MLVEVTQTLKKWCYCLKHRIMKMEPPENFEDVAITFSDEEWNMLSEKKRKLYREVMVQNYEMMISLGYYIPKEKLLALIERMVLQPASHVKEKQKRWKKLCRNSTKLKCVTECLEGPEKFAGKTKFKYASHQTSFLARVPLVKNNPRNHQTDQMAKRFGKKTNNTYSMSTSAGNKPTEFGSCKKIADRNFTITEYPRTQLTPEALQRTDWEESFQCKPHYARQHNHTHEKMLVGSDCGMSSKHCIDLNNKHQTHRNNKYSSGKSIKHAEYDSYVNAFQSKKPHQVQSEDKPHKCAECGRCYKQKAHLNRHKLTHTGFKAYECKDCGKSYKQKEALVRHQWVHAEKKPFECTVCGKGFVRKDDFSAHRLIHSGENMFKCSDCGKTFIRKHSLLEHQLTHADVRPFKCIKCGKSFARHSRLVRHEMIHTQEKLFKCTECGKSFGYKSHLIRHQIIHTVKPFVCKECGKSFRRKCYLLSHCLVHTGERPFECSKCWRTFAEKDHVTQHETLHSQKCKFLCSDCGKIYTSKTSLWRHQQSHIIKPV